MQGVGWLSIHPIDIEFPLWMGTWLGIYPTVETLVAQLLAFVFVIGSYFAAEWMRKREVRRTIAAHEESLQAEPARDETAAHGNGAGTTRNRVGRGCRPASAPQPQSPLTRSSSATPGGRCCSPRSCWSSRR